tara:strand:- start:325 stop:561 length:237 start_codon:yes stop_codon:yes gene_type:complete
MIISKIARAVLKLIMPDVVEHLMKIFKLDQLVRYMELPNSADKRLDKVEEQLIDPKEWKEVKQVIKTVKNMKKFKVGK